MHSNSPLRVVRKSAIHKEQEKRGADHPPRCALGCSESVQGRRKPNAQGFLFVTRNGRPPSSNKVVEYQLWPILNALNIPRCGLHAFRHSVASFIVDAGYAPEVAEQQLRHSNARTTLGYIHLRGGITQQAMTDVANSIKLDAVGRNSGKGSQYIQ